MPSSKRDVLFDMGLVAASASTGKSFAVRGEGGILDCGFISSTLAGLGLCLAL